jgi:hypothetical protein
MPGMFDEPAVRYEAADGTIVRPEPPADWARELVADAAEPCPVCGGATRERVRPADRSRGTQGRPGAERLVAVIVCVRCGHEGARAPGLRSSSRTRAFRSRAITVRRGGCSTGFTSRSTRSPAPAPGWPATAGVRSVTMSHDGVQIEAEALQHAYLDARQASAHALTTVLHNLTRRTRLG